MGTRKAGDCRHHDAGKKLHSGNVTRGKRIRSGRENFEYPKSTAEMAQWRGQNRPHAQPLARSQIDLRILLSVMAKHNFTGTDAIGRNAGIGLKTDTKIRRGASGAGTAHHLIAFTERDRRATGSGQCLRAFGDYADGGFQINFSAESRDVPTRRRAG